MEIKNLQGEVLFKSDSPSIKETIEDANINLVNLSKVNLRCADLSEADFSGANLAYANLRGADLRGAKNMPYIPLACPSEGSFIGWKKIHSKSIDYLVKLRIPADARKIVLETTLKCRCDKAEVLSIECLSTGYKGVKQVVNHAYGHECTYTVGKMVYPDSFDENRWNKCSHGIHYFINKQDAIDY